jgi:hypothetical protein
MWTETTRPKYAPAHLRYATDSADAELALIANQLPEDRPLCRSREMDLREALDAILHVLRAGWVMSLAAVGTRVSERSMSDIW